MRWRRTFTSRSMMSEGEMTKTDWSQQATRTSISPLSVKRLSMQQRDVTELPLDMGREGNSTTEGFSSSQRMWRLSVRACKEREDVHATCSGVAETATLGGGATHHDVGERLLEEL